MRRHDKTQKSRKILFLFLILFFICINIFELKILFQKLNPPKPIDPYSKYPEVTYLNTQGHWGFSQYQQYFKSLAKVKGAVYAFKILKMAHMAAETDIHLLGHTVGDELYKQKGAEGIKYCTQDFRNACSHSIVTGLFADKGLDALKDIAVACKKAPGGSSYTICYHGLGHGILAYFGYDMAKTVDACKQIKPLRQDRAEIGECVGGAVMEIISGGFHDRTLWEQQRPKYLNPQKPLALCTDVMLPPEARPLCVIYMSPYLQEVAGLYPGNRKYEEFPKYFSQAFPYCESLKGKFEYLKYTCYGAFGKDFVVMAKQRDIRNISNMTNQELKTAYDWCLLAKDDRGIKACITQAIGSLYWAGDNGTKSPIAFCAIMPDKTYSSYCWMSILNFFSHYKENSALCKQFPDSYRSLCTQKLAKT